MDLKSFTPTNGVVLPQRPLPRTKCIPRLIQTGSTRKRSTCFSPATIVLCLAVGARGRPQRAQRSAVCLMSIRDAREAIRDCLRENRTMPVLQALPEDSLQQILDTMTRMELKAGEHIFRKGEPVDAVYVVESGELSVVKPLRQGEEEEAFEATTLGTDFFEIIDRLEEEIGGECQMPEEILDREPASVFVVSDGSGYSAGGAVNLALKQFENQANKNCETVNVTSFPYIRYKGEISQVAKRARQENALIVYTLMRKEPRQAMLEELERPLKEGENPLRAVDLWEPLLLSMEDLLGIPRNSEA
ncbi:unnamed protein product, partial [Durusdinium trenchii]